MAKEENPNLALRIQVESGGCHGFQYSMSLMTLPLDSELAHAADSLPLSDDDVVFQFTPDETVAAGGTAVAAAAITPGVPKIVLDSSSLDFLKGSKVDFVMELIGSEFKIADNPLATSSCGCGASFDIKM
jgi:Fe-S cluster assembly iron-binding protein IscA